MKSSREHLIEIDDLHFAYGANQVLRGVNLRVPRGKVVAILGVSGSGKSTLLKLIGGQRRPQHGKVAVDGKTIYELDNDALYDMRREMGMIFQGAALFDSLTVLENVRFPLDMFSSMNAKERDRRALECLERVNLLDARNKFPGEISGGMQKRVAIARAIVLNPKYLFCDEPNSGLDPKTSLVIDNLLAEITKEYNITTIINTHDMNSVMGIGENIVFIYKGHKEWQGTKDDVMGATNKKLNDLVFASDLFRKVKEAELAEEEERERQ